MSNRIIPTLQKRDHTLSASESQRKLLADLPLRLTFAEATTSAGHEPLRATGVTVLQMNVGKRCNLTCKHCHVDAGPDRPEVMSAEVMTACMQLLEKSDIPTVDITGGAPEMHPQWRELIQRARGLGRHVMHRCNLTITRLPNYSDVPKFLADHQAEVIASLPAFAPKRTDAQRGEGVFEESIAALREFNALGYGQEGSGLEINLVTNPVGAFLPASQKSLEQEWKRELKRRYDVTFNNLFTITNMPISRFLDFLVETGNLESYMEKLVNAFNPMAVGCVMCRYTLSVGWDGKLYDCDFNQMLDMALPQTIFEADLAKLNERAIMIGEHCFGCTAGAGSSCGGAIAEE
jgi:radical SAM/Cys-rich protein